MQRGRCVRGRWVRAAELGRLSSGRMAEAVGLRVVVVRSLRNICPGRARTLQTIRAVTSTGSVRLRAFRSGYRASGQPGGAWSTRLLNPATGGRCCFLPEGGGGRHRGGGAERPTGGGAWGGRTARRDRSHSLLRALRAGRRGPELRLSLEWSPRPARPIAMRHRGEGQAAVRDVCLGTKGRAPEPLLQAVKDPGGGWLIVTFHEPLGDGRGDASPWKLPV